MHFNGSFDMTSTAMQHIPSADMYSNERVEHHQHNNNTAAPAAAPVSRGSSFASVATGKPSVPKCIDKTKILLPVDFQPSDYTIICGNKRRHFNSPGNSRLRVLVQSFIPQFSQAEGKFEKGLIVSKVMNMVKEACPVGAFVANEKGRWWQVSERTSREKVGSLFRDFLANKYKSSAQNKIARRKSKREEKKQKRATSISSTTPENVASLPNPFASSQQQDEQQNDEDESISSGGSCSFYDVDDLCAVQMEDL